MYRWALLLAASFFAVGCSSVMTADECQSVNWYNKGLIDGQTGVYKEQLDDYVKICSKANVVVDKDDYSRGYMEGLKEYCTFDRGMDIGVKGGASHNCPADSEYAEGYAKGIARHIEMRERRAVES